MSTSSATTLDALPTVDDVVVATAREGLAVGPPGEAANFGCVAEQLANLVAPDTDVVVMNRAVGAAG